MYTSCTFSPLADLAVHDVHEGLLSTVGYGSQVRSAHEQFAPWVLLPVPLHATISINCKVDWQKNSLTINKSAKKWLQICLWFHPLNIMGSETQRPNVYNSKLPDPKGHQQDSLKFLAEVKYIVCSSACSWLRLGIFINDHVLWRWSLDWQRQS